jgi:hypothetical protein
MNIRAMAEHVIVHDDGSISLSEQLRHLAGIDAGDELLIRWLPPDEIIMRKRNVVTETEFEQAMSEFAQQLRDSGYDSKDKIVKLIREVKLEQAEDLVK